MMLVVALIVHTKQSHVTILYVRFRVRSEEGFEEAIKPPLKLEGLKTPHKKVWGAVEFP